MKTLRFQYIITMVAALLIVLVYETGMLDKPTVLLPAEPEFWLATVMALLTLALIPLSLKLLSYERVKCEVSADTNAYFKWATCRWAMLSLAIVGNLVVYYVFSTTTASGYLALLSAVAYLFVWPSRSRMDEETQS